MQEQFEKLQVWQVAIEQASRYTQFIDEVSGKQVEDPWRSKWLANIDKFIEGLNRLNTRGRLTEQNVLKLFRPSTTISVTAGTALGSPDAWVAAPIIGIGNVKGWDGAALTSTPQIRKSNFDLTPRKGIRIGRNRLILQDIEGQKARFTLEEEISRSEVRTKSVEVTESGAIRVNIEGITINVEKVEPNQVTISIRVPRGAPEVDISLTSEPAVIVDSSQFSQPITNDSPVTALDLNEYAKGVVERENILTVGQLLDSPWTLLSFRPRIRKALGRLNISTFRELTMITADELFEQKNFGRTSLGEVRNKLARFGLTLRGGGPFVLPRSEVRKNKREKMVRVEDEEVRKADLGVTSSALTGNVIGKQKPRRNQEGDSEPGKHNGIHLIIPPFGFSENGKHHRRKKEYHGRQPDGKASLLEEVTHKASTQDDLSKVGKHTGKAFSPVITDKSSHKRLKFKRVILKSQEKSVEYKNHTVLLGFDSRASIPHRAEVRRNLAGSAEVEGRRKTVQEMADFPSTFRLPASASASANSRSEVRHTDGARLPSVGQGQVRPVNPPGIVADTGRTSRLVGTEDAFTKSEVRKATVDTIVLALAPEEFLPVRISAADLKASARLIRNYLQITQSQDALPLLRSELRQAAENFSNKLHQIEYENRLIQLTAVGTTSRGLCYC